LRADDDAGHELELGDGREEPEEDERLVERRVDVVRPLPAGVYRWIGPENVVVDLDVPVAELLDRAGVCAHGVGVGPQLRLRIDDARDHAGIMGEAV